MLGYSAGFPTYIYRPMVLLMELLKSLKCAHSLCSNLDQNTAIPRVSFSSFFHILHVLSKHLLFLRGSPKWTKQTDSPCGTSGWVGPMWSPRRSEGGGGCSRDYYRCFSFNEKSNSHCLALVYPAKFCRCFLKTTMRCPSSEKDCVHRLQILWAPQWGPPQAKGAAVAPQQPQATLFQVKMCEARISQDFFFHVLFTLSALLLPRVSQHFPRVRGAGCWGRLVLQSPWDKTWKLKMSSLGFSTLGWECPEGELRLSVWCWRIPKGLGNSSGWLRSLVTGSNVKQWSGSFPIFNF